MKRTCLECGKPTPRVEHPVSNGAYGELVVEERAVCDECAAKAAQAQQNEDARRVSGEGRK